MTRPENIPSYYVPKFSFERLMSRRFTIAPENITPSVGQYKLITGCEEQGDAHSVYMARYVLAQVGSLRMYLHVFHRSDMDRVMHDHPWNFLTIILLNGYIEHTPLYPGIDWHEEIKPLSVKYRPADWRHRVELIDNKPAVTIMITGKKCRSWGFWEGNLFTHWRDYFRKNGC